MAGQPLVIVIAIQNPAQTAMPVPKIHKNQSARRRVRSPRRTLACWVWRVCRSASWFTSYGGAEFWARQASNIWSKSIVLLLRKLGGKRRLDTVDLHADVALAEAEDLRHVAVAEAIQHQQRERAVPLVELRDPLIDPVEPRIRAGRRDEQSRGVLDVLPTLAVPAFLAAPGKRRVQCHPVNPGGCLAIASPGLDAVPELQRDFLEEILAIGMGGAIDARHLEQDGLVRVNP